MVRTRRGKMCGVDGLGAAPAPWLGLPPAPGRLLVSAPSLTESTFHRTVIYLLEHLEAPGGGTVGVILNRPSRTPVGSVLPTWQDVMTEPSVVFGGGPVQPDGALCLGSARTPSGDATFVRPVSDGVATVDLDADVDLVAATTSALRVFAGHSGWSAGQLDDELAGGAWYVVDGSADDVFSADPTPMWRRVLRRQRPPLSMLSTYPAELAAN